MSFGDFVWLFELERETTSKRQKPNLPDVKAHSRTKPISPSEKHYTISTNSTSRYTESSPTSPGNSFHEIDTGGVVLRRNQRRMTMPARLQRHKDLALLSPIQPEGSLATKRPPSNDLTG